MRVLAISVTNAGRHLAERLPYEHHHGHLGDTVRAGWQTVDGFVLIASTGAAVRIIGPLLQGKDIDPAVVVVDDQGRWAVPVVGGHRGGANELASQVAGLLDAIPVITTATDLRGMPPLDSLPSFGCSGDVAAVTRALLDDEEVALHNDDAWPVPPHLADRVRPRGPSSACPRIVVDHRLRPNQPGEVVLHPARLVIGVGSSSGAPVEEMDALVREVLAGAGLASGAVAAVATLDRKRHEPAVVALANSLGVPVRTCCAQDLGKVAVPTPSEVVRDAVGTPSVCEAAALLVAGPDSDLLVTKRTSATSTVAIARRARPAGHLSVVGLGPGAARHRTPDASAALRHADVVIGYGPYVELARSEIGPAAKIVSSPIGEESARCSAALTEAEAGRRVALVCSGDAGVYALATLVFEIAPRYPSLDPLEDITVVPGVTAALATAAVLGAPLAHDHAVISLSDLLTPWSTIASRLKAAAEADLVVALYNPRSAGRNWQLRAACDLLANHRPPLTPVGVVTDAGRTDQLVTLTNLADLDPSIVGMTSCVIVGASSTRIVGGRMITPRGYRP